ncbi:PucR family transcriptional regulator [Brevibacillus sp. SAFN-007a]|uniref:PucR family transcriptional regulator n=1 Tax=Brevibacillus sp. SAFN-007a TaxID=3436862 RepID=UPI003F815C7C
MITVRELIQVGGFAEGAVLTGEEFLDRELLGVTSFDSPDGHRWLRPGEFVLTTGFPFLTQEDSCAEGLIRLIDELVETGSPGLAIKLGRYIESVPPAVLAHAQKRQLPILSFPMEKAWSDVIVPVVQYINDKQRMELNRTHAIYERFHRHLTAKDPVSNLAGLLQDLLQTPVSIQVPGCQWKWESPPEAFPAAGAFTQRFGQTASHHLRMHPLTKGDDGCHIRWLLHDQKVQGAIILGQIDRELHAWEKVAIEQCAALLSLEIERMRSVTETYQRFRNDFLQLLLCGEIHSQDVLRRKADEVGWQLADHYTAIVLGVSPHERTGIANWHENHSLLEALRPVLSSLDVTILFGLDQDNRVVWLVPTAAGTASTADSMRPVLEAVRAFCWQQPVFVGLGRFHPGREGLVHSYREAQISFRTALQGRFASTRTQTVLVDFRDLGLERILFAEQPGTEAYALAGEYLGRVKEYDQEKNGQLLQTLQLFLQTDGNHTETAAQLFVHKNTIKYRLALIRELSGLNPENGHDQLLLRIAMTVQSIGYPQAEAGIMARERSRRKGSRWTSG